MGRINICFLVKLTVTLCPMGVSVISPRARVCTHGSRASVVMTKFEGLRNVVNRGMMMAHPGSIASPKPGIVVATLMTDCMYGLLGDMT